MIRPKSRPDALERGDRPAGRTIFTKDYMVALTKEGESLGAKEKKVECVVTGGLGRIPVSYKGVQYFGCCSGCQEAFNDNQEKYEYFYSDSELAEWVPRLRELAAEADRTHVLFNNCAGANAQLNAGTMAALLDTGDKGAGEKR